MPRQGQKRGNRDDEYKPEKDEDPLDIDIDKILAPKSAAKVTKAQKGTPKGTPKGGPKQYPQKGTPKGGTPKSTPKATPRATPTSTPRSTPIPSTTSAYQKPSAPPNTRTAAPLSTTIKTPQPSDPYFCCQQPLPSPSTFPLALQPFYTFLLQSLTSNPTTKPKPKPNPANPDLQALASLPPSKTYYRFSHLSLTTCTEVHRYFVGVGSGGGSEMEGDSFVEGSEEEVLGKVGALDKVAHEVADVGGCAVGRRQDVMILSRNASCVTHMKEGFWYVLMRVEQVEGEKEGAKVGGGGVAGVDEVVTGTGDRDGAEDEDEDELEHEIDLDLYS